MRARRTCDRAGSGGKRPADPEAKKIEPDACSESEAVGGTEKRRNVAPGTTAAMPLANSGNQKPPARRLVGAKKIWALGSLRRSAASRPCMSARSCEL